MTWGVLREGITANFTVTLAKPFQGTDYFALATPLNDSDITTGLIGIYNKTTSTFMSRIINGSAGVATGFRAWFAIGY